VAPKWENLRERGHLEDPDVDGEDNIQMDLQEAGWGTWTGSSWLRTGTGGGHMNAVLILRVP
jgi:hypothetical protein